MRDMRRANVVGPDEPRVPEICYAVARLERAVRVAIVRQVAPYGLTTLQYTVLSVLHRHGAPLSNAELARRAYMRPQSMSEVIDALECKGLIKRDPHPTHRRLLPAKLTPKGRRVLATCDQAVIEIEDTMLAAYGVAKRRAFVEMARAALSAVRASFLQELDQSPTVLDDRADNCD